MCDCSALSSPCQKPLGIEIKHPAQPLLGGVSATWTEGGTLKPCTLIPAAPCPGLSLVYLVRYCSERCVFSGNDTSFPVLGVSQPQA